MAAVAQEVGWTEERLFKATLDALGLKRLTKNVEVLLVGILPLAREQQAD
jgi:hypothetical protein